MSVPRKIEIRGHIGGKETRGKARGRGGGMYGVINHSVKQLVLEKFGPAAWEDIIVDAGFKKEEAWVLTDYYSDGDTVNIVVAAAAKLGVDAGAVLEIYGGYFPSFLIENQLDKMLHLMGNNLKDFLYNLDYLHAHLQDTWPKASFPHFRVEERKGTPGFFLHYTSTRGALLAPFVKGLVTTVAKVLFKADVEITVETNEKGGVFHISNSEGGFAKCGSGEMTVAEVDAMSVRAMNIASQVLDKSIFDSVFFLKCWPFFILFDTDMKIEACGPSLTLKIPQAEPGALLTDIFEVQRPLPVRENFTFENVQKHTNVTFRLVSKSGLDQVMNPLVLRGGMHQADGQILFLCSVHMLSIADMIATGTHMSELPLHDSARDLLFMSETSTAQQSMNNRLEVMLQELAQERARSDELLFSMLPSPVVNDLKEGRRVRGIEYERVTILFSDIVGFTDLSSNSKPQRICNMLDELYTVFDAASNFFDVYKVETIGDAYMIAGGIVGDVKAHATAIADFAFVMHAGARMIRAPHDNKQLNIRVGMHSGPATTGVVGIKMPRFCFFGDTVNTASRMESNGLQGQIHVSAATAKHLEEAGYELELRGDLEVKGKGKMQTYWLKGHPEEKRPVIKEALKAAKAALQDLRDYRRDEDSTSASDADEGSRKRVSPNRKAKKAPLWAPKRKSLAEQDEVQLEASIKTLKRVNSKRRMSMDASSTFTRTADDVSSGSDVDIEDRPQTVNRSLDAPPAEEVNQKLSITVGEKVPSSEEEVVVDDVDDETPTPTSRGRRKMSIRQAKKQLSSRRLSTLIATTEADDPQSSGDDDGPPQVFANRRKGSQEVIMPFNSKGSIRNLTSMVHGSTSSLGSGESTSPKANSFSSAEAGAPPEAVSTSRDTNKPVSPCAIPVKDIPPVSLDEAAAAERSARMLQGFASMVGAGKCPFGFDKLARAADSQIKGKNVDEDVA